MRITFVLFLLICSCNEKTHNLNENKLYANDMSLSISNSDSLITSKYDSLDRYFYKSFNRKSPIDIINIYGQPQSIDSQMVRNKHNDSEDYIIKIKYDDLVFSIYHATEIKSYLIESILVTNAKIKTVFGNYDTLFNKHNIFKTNFIFGVDSTDTDTLKVGIDIGEDMPSSAIIYYLRGSVYQILYSPSIE